MARAGHALLSGRFEKAHAPAGASFAGSGGGTTLVSGGRGSSAIWTYVEFAFPAQREVLSSRTLIVKGTAIAAHTTVLRVDVQDVWEIPRAAAERIPAGVHDIDISRGAPAGRQRSRGASPTRAGSAASSR